MNGVLPIDAEKRLDRSRVRGIVPFDFANKS